MDINTFHLKMIDKVLLVLDDKYIIFRERKGKWELWNAKTGESILLNDTGELLNHVVGKQKISDLLDSKDFTFDRPLHGGRGAGGDGDSKEWHVLDGGGEDPPYKPDFPARINVRVKTKNREEAIKTFMREARKDPTHEHAITLTDDGFAHSYTHGGKGAVYPGAPQKNGSVIHNHPYRPDLNTFSKTDLVTSISRKTEKGINATYDNGKDISGYRDFVKGSHFKAKEFVKALDTATFRGKTYDQAFDGWLTRHQRTYGYKFVHKKVKL